MSGNRLSNSLATRLIAWLIGTSTLILCAALALLALYAARAFDHDLRPQIDRKLITLGEAIATDLRRAGRLAIPIQRMAGLDDYLTSTIADHAEMSYAALITPSGRLLASSDALQAALRSGGPLAADEGAAGDRRAAAHDLHRNRAALLARLTDRTLLDATSGRIDAVGQYADYALPIAVGGVMLARLHLGIDTGFIERKMRDLLLDILISLFVSIVVALEVLRVLLSVSVSHPLSLLQELVAGGAAADFTRRAAWRSRDELGRMIEAVDQVIGRISERYARLMGQGGADALAGRFRLSGPADLVAIHDKNPIRIRLPLFIFFFGLEVSRSFLPLYVAELYQPIPLLSREMVMALPTAIWMSAVLVVTPLGGMLAKRVDARAMLVAGMIPAALGMLMTGLATGIPGLLFWRAIGAGGMSIVSMAALLYISQTTPASHRARSMSVFVGATIAASLGATPIGGILADRLGYRLTFFVGAVLVAIAALFTWFLLAGGDAKSMESKNTKLSARQFFGIFLIWRVLLLFLCSAVPARVMLTGFFGFLTPLYLSRLDYGQAAIGRIMMCYFVVMVVSSPLASMLADRYRCHRLLLVLGGLCSGSGALSFALGDAWWHFVLSLLLIGLGQSLVTTTQLALLPILFKTECDRFGLSAIMAVFRMVERIGAIVGPLLCAGALAFFDYSGTAVILGGAILTMTAALGLLRPGAAEDGK